MRLLGNSGLVGLTTAGQRGCASATATRRGMAFVALPAAVMLAFALMVLPQAARAQQEQAGHGAPAAQQELPQALPSQPLLDEKGLMRVE